MTLASFSYLMNWIAEKEAPHPPDRVVEASPNGQKGGAGTATPGPGAGATSPPATSGPSAGNEDPSKQQPPGDSNGDGNPVVKMTFAGDIMFASKVDDLLKKNGWDYPYRYVKEYLSKADITAANLETPLTTRGTPQEKDYVYRSSPEALPALQAAGIDLVNTANNHILDYGTEGLLDTLDILDKAGMKRVGTGRNSNEAYAPVIMERNGMKIAFLGLSRVAENSDWYASSNKPGIAETYSTKLPLEAIAAAREKADLVVVFAHWGVERKDRPVKEQTDLAHRYIDQGADLVVASHPHVVQGFEKYKGKWIAYSMGNFIFTTNEVPETWESMILNAKCTKDGHCELQMIPVLTKWAQPVRMTEEDGAKLFNKLGRLSVNASIDSEGNITEGPRRTLSSSTPIPRKQTEAVKESDKDKDKDKEPSTSSKPGATPKPTPKPSTKPTETPKPTPKPTETPKSSTKPSETPKPSTKPTNTPKPSSKPSPTPDSNN